MKIFKTMSAKDYDAFRLFIIMQINAWDPEGLKPTTRSMYSHEGDKIAKFALIATEAQLVEAIDLVLSSSFNVGYEVLKGGKPVTASRVFVAAKSVSFCSDCGYGLGKRQAIAKAIILKRDELSKKD